MQIRISDSFDLDHSQMSVTETENANAILVAHDELIGRTRHANELRCQADIDRLHDWLSVEINHRNMVAVTQRNEQVMSNSPCADTWK